MGARHLTRLALACAACLAVGACGSSAPAEVSTPTAYQSAIPAPGRSTQQLLDWPEFGLDPQRSDSSERATGITAANVARLRRITVQVGGTVDSSPIYLHGALVAGAAHNVTVVTTTYGKTVALDANSGRVLWTFTPPGYHGWAGSSQITTTSPIADPDRRFVYAASPNGLIHKLALADGSEDRSGGSWPVSVTRDAGREKLAAALNIDGPDVLAATGGYYGDAPPYQGHLILIDRSSGRVRAVFNTLCANRGQLITPSSCGASGSAVWARSGAVVEPGGGRILISTGNGPWNGTTNFGDSVLELSFPGLSLRQSFTPVDQEHLQATDTDLGSSAPALLGADRAVIAGKDGIMRVLALSRLDGHPPAGGVGRHHRLGGELQRLGIPGGGELFTAAAVWRSGGVTTTFVADESGTAAYVLRGGRLFRAWQNSMAGTSPVMAGGLLYVYEPSGGGIYVYHPGSPRPIVKLEGSPGHWNSPIVVDGHIVEPEGNANEHKLDGTLELFMR
jgi:putative pyrroloquinoline-quinone binding quinoprotein